MGMLMIVGRSNNLVMQNGRTRVCGGLDNLIIWDHFKELRMKQGFRDKVQASYPTELFAHSIISYEGGSREAKLLTTTAHPTNQLILHLFIYFEG